MATENHRSFESHFYETKTVASLKISNFHSCTWFGDFVTDLSSGCAKTIFGGAKWFGIGSENRIKLILDCDEHSLEFHLLKEKESFWKVALPEENKNLLHYPYVLLETTDLTATFCLEK